MKQSKFLDEFFYYSSKVILSIPIIIVILGLVVKFNQKKEQNSDYKSKKIISTPIISPKLTAVPKPVKENSSFNLQGPLVCRYSSNEASISAYIKNKNIFVKINKKDKGENFLVSGDCLYSWKDNQYTGEKICGIGQYISLVSSLPFIDPSLVLNGELLLDKSELPIKKEEFDHLASFCKKEKINDEIFKPPLAIIFKNNP